MREFVCVCECVSTHAHIKAHARTHKITRTHAHTRTRTRARTHPLRRYGSGGVLDGPVTALAFDAARYSCSGIPLLVMLPPPPLPPPPPHTFSAAFGSASGDLMAGNDVALNSRSAATGLWGRTRYPLIILLLILV